MPSTTAHYKKGKDLRNIITRSIRDRLAGAKPRKFRHRKPKYEELLGCSLEFYMRFLEQQFKPGWTWDNWGTAWDIDHVYPCHMWNLDLPVHVKLCFRWWNTRPLCRAEHQKDSNTYTF